MVAGAEERVDFVQELAQLETEVASFRTIDKVSYQAAEIDRLESSVPVCTQVGATLLSGTILFGGSLMTAENVKDRQLAVEELAANDELREAIRNALLGYSDGEVATEAFVAGKRPEISSGDYKDMRKGMRSLATIPAALSEKVESPLLRSKLTQLEEFNATEAAKLMRGPIYYTPVGLRSKEDLHWYTLCARFRPSVSGRVIALVAADTIATRYGMLPIQVGTVGAMVGMMGGGFTLMPDYHGRTPKDDTWSRPTVYRGVRKRLGQGETWTNGSMSIASLDVLTSLSEQRKKIEANGHRTVFPTVTDGENGYHLRVEGIKNPLLALEAGRQIVANNIELGGDHRLTFLTGPNSGGKSTISKAVVQNQILAHLGAPVVADHADMTIADHIAYHVPMPPDQGEETGRFGFELKRVRGILDLATEKSLTVLDDCLDGTTHEERVAVLRNVMTAYRFLGGATLFSTHAHELVEQFEQQGEGQFIQVEFDNDRPTHRIIPGVSHTSHADRVAALHGFTKEQVEKALADHGHQAPEWF
ncbi:MAG TPA: hypothetical protein VG992_00830 [Candidatus Saccharimonadales bacterium]|nr:hypothetical protein [Candidatus Saccharimonadales bacterium]